MLYLADRYETSSFSGLQSFTEADRRRIPLNANENCLSPLARKMQASQLADRYLLGRGHERESEELFVKGDLMLGALPNVSRLEMKATIAAKEMWLAKDVDFRPLSGLHATLTSLLSFSKPGDLVLSIAPEHGGHFATRKLVAATGRHSEYLPWDTRSWNLDCAALSRRLREVSDVVILWDHGAPLAPVPAIEAVDADGCKPFLIYDASHTLGLMLGGEYQTPLKEGWCVLQGNTHKTLPGPQKGMILSATTDLGAKLEEMLSGALVSSQHTHHSLALFVTILEMYSAGHRYARQIRRNARAFAAELAAYGLDVIAAHSEFTDTHITLVKSLPSGAYAACRRLYECGIVANARHLVFGEILRFGVQEMTRLGATTNDMCQVANFVKRSLDGDEVSSTLAAEVEEFMIDFQEEEFTLEASNVFELTTA